MGTMTHDTEAGGDVPAFGGRETRKDVVRESAAARLEDFDRRSKTALMYAAECADAARSTAMVIRTSNTDRAQSLSAVAGAYASLARAIAETEMTRTWLNKDVWWENNGRG